MTGEKSGQKAWEALLIQGKSSREKNDSIGRKLVMCEWMTRSMFRISPEPDHDSKEMDQIWFTIIIR